jgi:tRNA pseudouridine55 synthase
VVDKPSGLTSHDVVARMRRLAGTRKVGHAGTLDPMATGVLLVGIGRATRLLGHLALTDKAYDATVRLGATTTTDDAEGEILSTVDTDALTDEAVRAAFAGQVGDLDQVPSAVSAIKVDGKRAYARVRAGEQVELAPRRVRIETIDVHAVRRVGDHLDAEVTVRCSTGTYIRSIARDVGAGLGVGGHLVALRRTAVGPFGLDEARSLDELAEHLDVVPLAEVARRCFVAVDLDERHAIDVQHGRRLDRDLPDEGRVAVFAPDGRFLALYERAHGGARAVAVFV